MEEKKKPNPAILLVIPGFVLMAIFTAVMMDNATAKGKAEAEKTFAQATCKSIGLEAIQSTTGDWQCIPSPDTWRAIFVKINTPAVATLEIK